MLEQRACKKLFDQKLAARCMLGPAGRARDAREYLCHRPALPPRPHSFVPLPMLAAALTAKTPAPCVSKLRRLTSIEASLLAVRGLHRIVDACLEYAEQRLLLWQAAGDLQHDRVLACAQG